MGLNFCSTTFKSCTVEFQVKLTCYSLAVIGKHFGKEIYHFSMIYRIIYCPYVKGTYFGYLFYNFAMVVKVIKVC